MGGAAVSSLLATPTPTSRPRSVSTTTVPFSVNLSTAAARAPRLLLLSRRPRPAAAALGVSDDTGVKMAGSDIVGKNDLLIVGPGVLGRLVAEKWQEEHPGCKVFGQTASTDHHNELSNIGIIPSLKGSTFPQKVPYVIFCAPPSRSDDYPGDVRVAASNWTGEGSFVFTSSTALYDCSDNELCNEDCPSVPIGRSPRTDVLLKAENVVLEAGGCVLRLAGLYISSIDDYLKGTLDTRPDHIINQIHYEDAASLAIAIMKKGHRGRIFLGCDNKPLSRQEIMDSVNRSGKFDTKFQGFTGTDGPLGKKMENSRTRSEIGWEPKYPSFTEFLGLDS
uniref:NAD-dependent epimerase/dehydratase domain-containing protein n=1 Tax=Oryza meridionalis TaxID=40149 RepID=A0A0E0C1Y2_9ORYZ